MTILSKEEIGKVRLTKADYEVAGRELVSVCKMTFKPGTEIRWRKNNHLQSGVVVHWNGIAAYPTIRVRNYNTDKTYDISLHDIDWERMNSLAATYENEFKALEKGVTR